VLSVALGVLGAAGAASAEFDPEAVFTTRCGACHTVGRGDDVGPDLAGVTERHGRDWLIPFIRSSQTVIRSGDPAANELFERFDRTKMPDHPYSEAEIHALLDYIEAGGPGDRVPRVRPAMDASAEEVELGERLFFGLEPLSRGGAACADCHSVSGTAEALTGSLGGDLRNAYTRYHDREITRTLIQMSPPVMDAAYRRHPLTDEENYALKAFLCRLANGDLLEQGGRRAQEAPTVPWLGLSVALVAGVLGDGSRRLRHLIRRRRTSDGSPE
jgi:mono/diheme cytochrome c family protein